MGGAKAYNPAGGFDEYLYRHEGEPITVGGVTAKITVKIGDDDYHSGTPVHSNTPDTAYITVKGKDKTPIQLKVFKGRTAEKDFDRDHSHTNKDTGKKFPKGVVHVQLYDENGNRDSQHARYMNNAEMKLYGPMIKFLNPNVKFRP